MRHGLRVCIDKINLLNISRIKNKSSDFHRLIAVTNKVLNDLIITRQIGIRELNKFSVINIVDEVSYIYNHDRIDMFDRKGFFILLLSYLNHIPDLKTKLIRCKTYPKYSELDFNFYVPLGFIPFSIRNSDKLEISEFYFNYKSEKISYDHITDTIFLIPKIIVNTLGTSFTNHDFYEILELNLDRLNQIN